MVLKYFTFVLRGARMIIIILTLIYAYIYQISGDDYSNKPNKQKW